MTKYSQCISNVSRVLVRGATLLMTVQQATRCQNIRKRCDIVQGRGVAPWSPHLVTVHADDKPNIDLLWSFNSFIDTRHTVETNVACSILKLRVIWVNWCNDSVCDPLVYTSGYSPVIVSSGYLFLMIHGHTALSYWTLQKDPKQNKGLFWWLMFLYITLIIKLDLDIKTFSYIYIYFTSNIWWLNCIYLKSDVHWKSGLWPTKFRWQMKPAKSYIIIRYFGTVVHIMFFIHFLGCTLVKSAENGFQA